MAITVWAFVALVVFCCRSIFFIVKNLRRAIPAKSVKPPLPPAISVLPFLAQILFFRYSLHDIELLLRQLHSLHGPILSLRLSPLNPPSIFISNAYLAHAALIHHADSFARRPPAVEPVLFLTAGNHDISSSDYGPLWRFLRQNLSSEALHPTRLRSFAPGRRWSVQLLLGQLRSSAGGGRRLVAKPFFQHAILSTLVLICFGVKLGESEIAEIDSLQSFLLSLFTSFNVFAVLPAVTKHFFYKRWKRIVFARQRQAEIFLPMIRARRERKQGTKDGDGGYELCYVDSLIDLQLPVEGGRRLTDYEMVNLCHEFLSGAVTTATTLEWTMAELVKRQGVQSKILADIEALIGRNEEEIVKAEDLERMPYVKAVVMESLRRHPPSHFVLPHSVVEEFELNGYLIPNGAEVHFAVANVHWDRWNWEEPMEFRPERFMAGGEGAGVDITGSTGIKMMPFGAGRRLCPGYRFALLHLEELVANLVTEFEWKAAAGEEVDLSESFEFTTVMKNPLRVQIVQRNKHETKDFAMTRRLKSFDSRGSMRFFYDIMAELKQDGLIVHRHEALLQRTPFHYIIQLPYLELNHSLLQELLVQFDKFDNRFSIADHHLEFRPEDVALIFGLPNHGKPVQLKSIKNKDFYHRVFEKGAVSRFEIVYHLRRHAMDPSEQSLEAFVVLLLGLFISTVLIPSSNAGIPSSLWSYIDELDHICDYDWAHLVYQELVDEIHRARREVTDEDADNELSDYTYGGCFLALQIWICGIAGLGKTERQGCSPRILGWGRNSMDGILEQFRSLHPSDIRSSLSPMESERHLLDSTILPCEVYTRLQPRNSSVVSKASSHEHELELQLHGSGEQWRHSLRFKEEVHGVKEKGAGRLLSENSGIKEDNYRMGNERSRRSQKNLEMYDTDLEEHGPASVTSDSSSSTEKKEKKLLKWQSSSRLASTSNGSRKKELDYSFSSRIVGGRVVGRRTTNAPEMSFLHMSKQHSGEDTGIEGEVKKKFERRLSLSTSSTRAKQKEPANTQPGNSAGTKASATRHRIIKKIP